MIKGLGSKIDIKK